ncbi:MAG: amidoligase family protein [Acidimicrobiia bacterium]|nr:amidoligase family protein [Acidimicrobiia bacterium]MDH5288580.1 amidoligase family protein [Acidimicrobiia bacterium]
MADGTGRKPVLRTRVGVEIELLAPPGSSRFALAEALATELGGAVTPGFHRDTEASSDPRHPRIHHLSQSVTVTGPDGRPRCRLVDDTTIRDELDTAAPPRPGRYRVLADDPRLIRLAERHLRPGAPIDAVLAPLAELFGTAVLPLSRGRFRVDDAGGSTVAMVVPQAGERERVCEIVTAVIDRDHRRALAELLEPAARAGFGVPVEAAVHVHLDAEPFRNGPRLGHLVRLFAERGPELRARFATNRRCRRLGPPPGALVALVNEPGFSERPWPAIEAALAGVGLTKYADVNLVNLWRRTPGKDTVEIRILPGSIDPDAIVAHLAAIEALVLGPLD